MTLNRRLLVYFRPQWKALALGVVMMGAYALLSGFSIGMVYPIIDRVFVKGGGPVSAESARSGGADAPGTPPPDAAPAPPVVSVGRELGALVHDAGARLGRGVGPGLGTDLKTLGQTHLDRILSGAPRAKVLQFICVTALCLVLLRNVTDYLRKIIFTRVEQRATEDLRNDVYRRIIHLPLTYFDRQHSGNLISRAINDVETVKNLTVTGVMQVVHNALQVVVYLVICFAVSGKLALFTFLVLPPIMFLLGRLAVRLKKHSGRAQQRLADITEQLQESIQAVRVVKAFANEEREVARFRTATQRYRATVTRLLSIDLLAAPLSEFWAVSVGVIVLWYGGMQVLDPKSALTAGQFFLFLFAMFSLMHPLKEISGAIGKIQRGLVAAGRVFELIDTPTEPLDEPGAEPGSGPLTVGGFAPAGGRRISEVRQSIRFRDVGFSYVAGTEVLRGISFEARVGETVAIVGPSGGGKTTLVDMVPRFYTPTTGAVEIDGVDTRELNLKDLRRLMGIVTQETVLFDDSVAANVAYGKPGATPAEIEAAARAANAHDFIAALPQGYDTPIGERGVLLSGGQRQRLAIARAILKNPPILIFDEATSSLDTESEALVQEAIDRLLEARTTFVIAHRLSTITRADRILVIEAGRIVESGRHEELLALDGAYRRLYRRQFRDDDVPALLR